MPKTTCSCADDSEKQYTNNAPNFFTFNHFDNKYVPSFQNPSRTLREMVSNGAPNSFVDRANCLTCDDTVTTQDKLLVRKKDRPTPYRVPYNHFRKVSSCNTTDCLPNVKINKDISCNEILDCQPVNYAIYRQVDKFGIRNLNNGGNYKNYLQIKGKNYDQNTFGILPECAISGKEHTFKIGAVENLVYNKNSNSQYRENCKLGYEIRSSKQEKEYSIIAMNTTTRKYSNPYHNTSGSVSSRAHINKKKFRNILAGQRIGKDGYNNCINGQLCSMFMAPGPNTKLILSKSIRQRCLPSRIRGRKQRCDYLTDAEYIAMIALQNKCRPQQKNINPQFQRYNYITGQQPGYLKITFNHCEISDADKVEFSFTGSSASGTSIFTSNSTFINASSSVTLVHTNKEGANTTLSVSDFFVNNNDFFFYYPVNVSEGTTQITIDDANNNIHLNNTNGSVGRIYANVIIPQHNTITSAIAWDVSTVCYGRNGSIIYNDNTATNDWITIDSTNYTNQASTATIPVEDGYNYFGPYIRIKFKIVGDNLKSGDVLKLEFYTTYSTGFFNGTTAINTFRLNGYGYNNPVLFIAKNTTNPTNSDIVSNVISSASWDGTKTSSITIGSLSGSWTLQTLNINIATTLSANDPTDNNDYYIINLESTKFQGYSGSPDYYGDFIFSRNPSAAATLRYELSCNCFTQTVNNSSATASVKQAKAWDLAAPGFILSFLSCLPTNFYSLYESNNADLSNNPQHQIAAMSWFSYQDKVDTSSGGEGSTSSGYVSDPKWISTSGDLYDISSVNQNRFHRVRFYTSKKINSGSEIIIKIKKQKNERPPYDPTYGWTGGSAGYFDPEFEPSFYSGTPQTRGAEKVVSGSSFAYLPIPYNTNPNGSYQDHYTFIRSNISFANTPHTPGNNNNWNVMDLSHRKVASDGTLSTVESDIQEVEIKKYTITPSTHRSSFGGTNPGIQVLTVTTNADIDQNRVVELTLYDESLVGIDGFNYSYTTGNVYHTLSGEASGPGVNIPARPIGLFENGPKDVKLANGTGSSLNAYYFGGKQIGDCERDGYKVTYDVDISNNGSSILSSPVSNKLAFYWKSIKVINNYSDFPKYADVSGSNITTTAPSYFIKTLPDLTSLPSSFEPTTIRFNHRTSIPKDSLVQIIFSTENFPYGIDSSGNNVDISGTSFKQGDFFGKGFLNPNYQTSSGSTGISNMTEGTSSNVVNWDGVWNNTSNVGTDKFGIRVLNKAYGSSGESNVFIKDIKFKRLEDVSRNTYDLSYNASSWHDGIRLSKGPFIQDLMQFKINNSVVDTNGQSYFDIQLVDGRNAHNGSNHTQNNSFQSWLPRIEDDVNYSGASHNYEEIASCFYITIMVREPLNDSVIASIVRHKIDMT